MAIGLDYEWLNAEYEYDKRRIMRESEPPMSSETTARQAAAEDGLALKYALPLRTERCPHGLPAVVKSAEPIPPWGKDAQCKPLCDACLLEALRAAIAAAKREAFMEAAELCDKCSLAAKAAELIRQRAGEVRTP